MRPTPGLLALAALAALSCSPASTVEPVRPISLGETFPLRVGQEVRLEEESLYLSFDEVIEDSRCPREVVCVWAGNARLRVGLGTSTPATRAAELNTLLDPRAASAFGYLVELDRLEPDPPPQGEVDPEAYTAYLRVSAAP